MELIIAKVSTTAFPKPSFPNVLSTLCLKHVALIGPRTLIRFCFWVGVLGISFEVMTLWAQTASSTYFFIEPMLNDSWFSLNCIQLRDLWTFLYFSRHLTSCFHNTFPWITCILLSYSSLTCPMPCSWSTNRGHPDNSETWHHIRSHQNLYLANLLLQGHNRDHSFSLNPSPKSIISK